MSLWCAVEWIWIVDEEIQVHNDKDDEYYYGEDSEDHDSKDVVCHNAHLPRSLPLGSSIFSKTSTGEELNRGLHALFLEAFNLAMYLAFSFVSGCSLQLNSNPPISGSRYHAFQLSRTSSHPTLRSSR